MSRPSVEDAAGRQQATGSTSPSPSPSDTEPLDPLREAELLYALLHDAKQRLSRLLAALKHQQRHSRAVRAAMDSLRQLRLEP